MDRDHLSERFTGAVGELRDRTAEALSTDGASLLRELAGLRDLVDERADEADDRFDDLEAVVTETARSYHGKHTTWPRKLFWIMIGAALGTAAAYLADPDRGDARRRRLSDEVTTRARETGEQVKTRARETSEQVVTQARQLGDKAKSTVIEEAGQLLDEVADGDAGELEERIRAEVLGHRDDASAVVLHVEAQGTVRLEGTVPSPTSERELLAAVSAVEGVQDVTSGLSVDSSNDAS